MDTITITLNGREVSGSPDSTILDLARQIGINIPTLCHHPLLRNAGACRVCLVEEVKSGKVVASCVTPISDGMDIRTDSLVAYQARRGVLELILSDHPSACVVCNKGNECILRSLAKDHGICDPDLPPIRHWRPIQEVNPFIVRDLTKCIMCGRCIRMCKDFEAVGAIEYMDRGYASHPGTAGRTPLEGSECNFCGSCVAICPTDALAERDRVSHSSGTETASAICQYCGTGCHLEYDLIDGKPLGVRGIPGASPNSLSLCVRGHYGHDALASQSRLTECLIRNDEGQYEPVSWNKALDFGVSRLRNIIDQYGESSIGIIVGPNCSNEDLYLATRLAREVLGTPNIDSTGRLSSGTLVNGIEASFGSFRAGGSLESILQAQTIVLIGARPDYTHPVIARNVRRAVRNNGAALIQIDPLTTELSRFARIRIRSGNDELPYTLFQLMRVLVDEKLHDENFFFSHALNPLEFIENIASYEIESDEDITLAAQLMGRGARTIFILGPGLARSAQGYILTRLTLNLPLLIGQPNNVLCLFQGCNELGMWEMGCSADRLPGKISTLDSDASEAIQEVWDHDISVDSGLNAVEILHALEKQELKAILLLGVDPIAVFPNVERTRKAFSNADLFVRVGLFPALEEECAHVVFPTTSIPEQAGTYTNTEGRVQRVAPVYSAPGCSQSISRFVQDVASRLHSQWDYAGPETIFQEICSICSGWGELTWGNISDLVGVNLPYPQHEPLTQVGSKKPRMVPYTLPQSLLATDGVPSKRTSEGKLRVYPEEQVVYPGDATVSRHSRRLSAFMPGQVVRLHPQDAEKISVTEGDRVLLSSDVGAVEARIAFDPEVPLSGVVIPIGGPDLLLSRLLDWPEEGFAPGWDTLYVSIKPLEDE